MKFLKIPLVKFLKLALFAKTSENAYDLSKFFAPILCSHVHMSADESLGSHQLNSFAAFLEEKLHTSSENSVVQIPQLTKMADGKKPQKGGKKLEVNTAFEIPDDLYEEIALLMKPNMARKTRISARCAYRGLNGDGHGNGGSTDMLLPSI